MGDHASIEPMLTIAFTTGTEPGKWFRRFEALSGSGLETLPSTDPLSTAAELALVRLPDARVDESFHVVRLYEEALGVAVPKDSVYAEVGDPVPAEELRDERTNFDFYAASDPVALGADRIEQLRLALQVVAANVGVAYAPLPLLRALSKKQIAALALVGADRVQTQIALVWKKERDCDEIQDFVGVAKGRTVRSSRQAVTPKRAGSKEAKTRSLQQRATRNRKRRRHPR